MLNVGRKNVECSSAILTNPTVAIPAPLPSAPILKSQKDVAVANPPTLLLLVDSLLRDLAEPSGERNDADASAEVCSAEGGDRSGSRAGRPASPTWDRTARESTVEFLRKAHPVLDQWVRWLLITQRPGAQGWGGQAKDSPAPVGAFQVQ